MKMKKPFKFSVDFEYDHEPTSLSISELHKIVKYLSKMSNSDYKFTFKAPLFLEVTNDDGIKLEKSN
jgi:hypothetical protein